MESWKLLIAEAIRLFKPYLVLKNIFNLNIITTQTNKHVRIN